MPHRAARANRQAHFRWQLAVLTLTVLVLSGALWSGTARPLVLPMVVCLALMSAATVLAWAAESDRLPARWHIAVPVVSLLGALVLGVDVLLLEPAGLLVAVVPGMWLIFEYGRRGTCITAIALAAVLERIYFVDVNRPYDATEWLTFLALVLGSSMLLVGAHQVAASLTLREEAYAEQSRVLSEALETSQDRRLLLQAILETVDAVIVAYDNEGNLLLDNPRARQMSALTGISVDGSAVPGFHMYEADRVTRVPHEDMMLFRVLRGEEFAPETLWFGPPGHQVALLLSSKHIYRTDGGRLGFVIVGLDITDILEALRVREEFLTTVSHELRTPLTSIMGYHELIEDALGPDDQQIASMLRVAQRNAGVLLSRVSQLLQVSGSESSPTVHPRPTDLTALVEAALAKHRVAATDAGVRLDWRLQQGVCALVDPDGWEQVVDNLVSNGVKYTGRGGAVTVALVADDDRVTMRVADTGVGMSMVDQKHAFDRFYRAASASENAIQGIGVGLSVVKSIVDAHGGDVTLSSAPGTGTEVVVTLAHGAGCA